MTGCATGQSAPMTLSEQRPSLRDIGWRVLRGFALLVIGVSIGFGVMSGQDGYDPHLFAIGVTGLFALVCTFTAYLFFRNRSLKAAWRAAEQRAEELADSNWEMKEAEERARGFLEAQGDLIVRRGSDGHVTYANDAYGALAGTPRAELIGRAHQFEIIEQGETATLAGRHARARPENRQPRRRALDRLARCHAAHRRQG